jgi:type II secretory pathway component PulC
MPSLKLLLLPLLVSFTACATTGPRAGGGLDGDDNFALNAKRRGKDKLAGVKATKRRTSRVDRRSPNLVIRLADGRRAISRAALRRFLRQGAQRFIQNVRVRPTFRAGRFAGWRVLAYIGPGHLRRGDVVRRVNGKSIERPGQVMAVWKQLATSDKLVLELVQRGKARVVTLPIVDSPSANGNGS